MSFGTLGLFAVSVIDSSIIPLPVPGSTDLLLILLVVHRANPVLAAVAAIAGSILGGYLTWAAGAKGGEAALQRYLPKRFSRRLSSWGRDARHACRHRLGFASAPISADARAAGCGRARCFGAAGSWFLSV